MKSKHITAILCSLALAASGASMLPAAAEEQHILYAKPQELTPRISAEASDEDFSDLPPRYDLREQGLVTPIRNQKPYGTCWSFGIMGSLEGNEVARNPHIDLSEWYTIHYSHKGPLGDPVLNHDYLTGGNYDVGYNTLLNWVGPVPEALYPYDSGTPDFDRTLEELQQEAVYHVTDVIDFDFNSSNDPAYEASLRDTIKRYLCQGKMLYFDVNAYYKDVYNDQHHSYYTPPGFNKQLTQEQREAIDGHTMTLVGYDDDYPAENFIYRPEHNGAWIIKNSWGSDWGDDGFLYISYEDTSYENVALCTMESAERRDTLFSYDTYSCSGGFSIEEDCEEVDYAANCFTAQDDTWITEVMIDCVSVNDVCDITVYSGLTGDSPISGTPSAVTTATLTHTKYQTIPLNEPVFVKAGDRFAVTVKYTGEKACHIPCEIGFRGLSLTASVYPAVMMMRELQNTYDRDAIADNFHRNESFYSADGEHWEDLYDSRSQIGIDGTEFMFLGNIGIKAVGVKSGFVEFSDYHDTLPAGTELALSTPEDAPIYYAVNGGEYQLYEKPIVYDGGELTVSAYADTGDKKVFTRSYTQQRAELTTLLYDNGEHRDYLDLNQTEFEILYDPALLEQIRFVPTATGDIALNGSELPRGTQIRPGETPEEKELTITVSKENLLTTTYTIKMIRDKNKPYLRNGTWMCCEYGEDENQVTSYALEFWNGKGLRKDLTTGETELFTYEKDAEIQKFCFTYADREENFLFQNTVEGAQDGNSDTEDTYVFVLADGRFAKYTFCSPRPLEEYGCFSEAEIIEAITGCYASLTGKQPTKVVRNADKDFDVYEGDEIVSTFAANNLGNMWSTSLDPEDPAYAMFYKTSTGDINHDHVVNASDAAQILVEAAAIGAGSTSTFDYAQQNAGDVNGDGNINASDAANILTYAAAVGAGDQEIRLSDFMRAVRK